MNSTENLQKCTAEFPNRLIKLRYSFHAKERLQERTTGSLILAPQYVRLTWGNTIERRIKKNRVVEATMVLEYKKGVNMYLPIIVNSGIVKTVFFRNVKKNRKPKKELFSKEDSRTKANREFEKTIQTQAPITIRTGEKGFRAYVEFIQPTMERLTITQKMLGLWNKYIRRK